MHARTAILPRRLREARQIVDSIERAALAPLGGIVRGWREFVSWAFRLGTTMRNNACNGIVDTIDQGSGAGTLKIYTSTQPGAVGGSYGTLLGTLTYTDPAFGNSSTGTATASSITSDTSADNSGTAGTFAILDSDANVLADGTCGTSGTDMVFDNATIVAGGTIACSSFTVTVPIS